MPGRGAHLVAEPQRHTVVVHEHLERRIAQDRAELGVGEALARRGDERVRAEPDGRQRIEGVPQKPCEGREVGGDLHAVPLSPTRGHARAVRRVDHRLREPRRDLVRIQATALLEVSRVEVALARGTRGFPHACSSNALVGPSSARFHRSRPRSSRQRFFQ